jgi:hypothetical protein
MKDQPTGLGLGFTLERDWRRRGRRCPGSVSHRGRSPEALSRSQCDLVVLESAYQIGSGVQWLELLLLGPSPSRQQAEERDVEDGDEQRQFPSCASSLFTGRDVS